MKVRSSHIWRIGILFAFIAIAGSVSVSRPDILTKNEFLKAFMGPDMVSVLVVILTITFASVANIHLSISRIIGSCSNRNEAMEASKGVRKQINSNAWLIFWAFLVALLALFFYGQFPEGDMVRSICISICLSVFLMNGLVMHDLYRTIFILVENYLPNDKSGDGQDFSQDTPPTE